MKIKEWNNIPKDEETQVEAVEGDICTLIDGVAFLIQRKNDWNNVVCIRVSKSDKNILHTFNNFRAWCEKKKIQYIRVEGISHTYKMLYLALRLAPKTCNVVKADDESKEYGRHIYYVKTY